MGKNSIGIIKKSYQHLINNIMKNKNYIVIETSDGENQYWECIDHDGFVMYRKDTYEEIVFALWHQNIGIDEVEVYDLEDFSDGIVPEFVYNH